MESVTRTSKPQPLCEPGGPGRTNTGMIFDIRLVSKYAVDSISNSSDIA